MPEPNNFRAQLLLSVLELNPNRGFQCNFELSCRTHSPPCRGRYIGRSAQFSSEVFSLFWICDVNDNCVTSGLGDAIRSPNSRPPIKSTLDRRTAVIRTDIRESGGFE